MPMRIRGVQSNSEDKTINPNEFTLLLRNDATYDLDAISDLRNRSGTTALTMEVKNLDKIWEGITAEMEARLSNSLKEDLPGIIRACYYAYPEEPQAISNIISSIEARLASIYPEASFGISIDGETRTITIKYSFSGDEAMTKALSDIYSDAAALEYGKMTPEHEGGLAIEDRKTKPIPMDSEAYKKYLLN